MPTAIGVDPSSGDVVIAFGEDGPAGTTLVRVRKYDPEGSELWTATESGTDVSIWPSHLAIAPDGDVLVLGSKDLGMGADYDVWLARYAR